MTDKIKEELEQKQSKNFISIKYKGKEIRIYKWENKPFKDFPMPKGFDWCEYFDFVELINDKKIKLEKYPIIYFIKNQFKLNSKKGYCLSGLYLSRDLDLYSNYDILASSDLGGRVVVRKIPEKLNVTKLTQHKQTKEEMIKDEIKWLQSVLDTKHMSEDNKWIIEGRITKLKGEIK